MIRSFSIRLCGYGARPSEAAPYRTAEWKIEETLRMRMAVLDLKGSGDTRLTELPESLSRLTQLKRLDISGNQLTALPESLDRLTQLKWLELPGNQLTTLPESLGQLTQLRALNLSGNQLTEESKPDAETQIRIPEHWQVVRERLRETKDAHLSLDRFFAICREQSIESEDARLLLRICRRVGDLIHYEHDPVLRDIVGDQLCAGRREDP